MAGPQSDVAIQKYGVVPFATGLTLGGLAVRTLAARDSATDFVIAGALLAVGWALAAHDVRRRSSRLKLRFPSPEAVTLEEPGKPPRVFSWAEVSVFEPGCLGTLRLLAIFLGSVGAAVRVLWDAATGTSPPGADPWNALLAVSVMGWFAAFSGSALAERTRWVELRFPGRHGAACFSYRELERLGALEGLKAAQKTV